MKHMMEGVVLRGTGKRRSSTATALPARPARRRRLTPSGRYSHRQHIASFAGFAPVNNPAVTVLVVLDSPAGGYPNDGGGEAAAPVFARIAQQVLAYMNVPHDVEAARSQTHVAAGAHQRRRCLRGRAGLHCQRTGACGCAAGSASQPHRPLGSGRRTPGCGLLRRPAKPLAPAAPVRRECAATRNSSDRPALKTPEQPRGTVVLDVAGGVLVPDFRGKSLRTALEEAESAGMELEVSGSGVGQDQSPAAGSRIPPGGHVAVLFGR